MLARVGGEMGADTAYEDNDETRTVNAMDNTLGKKFLWLHLRLLLLFYCCRRCCAAGEDGRVDADGQRLYM